MTYADIAVYDVVLGISLYAYFVPSGTAISVESIGKDAGIQGLERGRS